MVESGVEISEEQLTMTTITLDVPDELAARITALRDRAPELISRALELWPADESATA
jgi:hypothetical protein